MGTLIGHVAPGFAFFVIGLWHLIHNIKRHALNPKSYTSSPWFPSWRIKYLELYLIMFGSLMSISMELFIGPERHQPFDPDGTIPSNHLHNLEHSNISLTFLTYAVFAIILDRLKPPAHEGLTYILGSLVFGQQLLVFHLHSADHMGVEGQYHWLLQVVILVSLTTTLLGTKYNKSFLNSFVRSVSVLFQGVWLAVMGFMLWTPSLIPKDCFMNLEEDHRVVRCHSEVALERAKSLVNIEFSWYLIGVTVLSLALYLYIVNKYRSLTRYVLQDDYDDDGDVEAQKSSVEQQSAAMSNFFQIGKPYGPMDIER